MTWDDLAFRCGLCGAAFTSTDARLHVVRVDLHVSVHELADLCEQLGDMSPADALRVAVDMARAVVAGAPRVAEELLPGVTVAVAAAE